MYEFIGSPNKKFPNSLKIFHRNKLEKKEEKKNKMSKRCCAKMCFNSQTINKDVTYFGFPKYEEL